MSGTPDSVGWIFRCSFKRSKELGLPEPHWHYCKLILMEPQRRHVIKAYAERGGSYGHHAITGFDDARFIDLGGRTKVTFDYYSELKGTPPPTPAGVVSGQEDNHMLRNLENLKRIVEGQPEVMT
jgi:hypothetical protein